MQIEILSPVNIYNGIKIYVRGYGDGLFEFMFCRKGEIYTRVSEIRAAMVTKVMAEFGKSLFTDEQIKQIKARLEREAIAVIKLLEAQEKVSSEHQSKRDNRAFINRKLNG